MAVEAVGNGSSPYVQNTNDGGGDVPQLQQQKEMLKKQLEDVKSKPKNSQTEQDEAVRQIQLLKSKIAQIDQKIQKLSQNQRQGQNVPGTSVSDPKKAALSQSNSPLTGVRQVQTSKSGPDDKSETADRALDAYA